MEEKVEFYKETEFGEFPKDWELKKLKDIVKIESGKRERGGGKGNGEVLSLGGENISPVGKLILNSPKYISKKFYNSLKSGRAKEKDILFVKDGATTGKVAFIDELPTKEVAVNEHLFIIRNKTINVDQKFLYYIMKSNVFQNQIKSVFHGIIGGITKSEMEEFYVPLPSLEEQQKIAEILSNIDGAIQKTEEIIDKTESLKKGLMQELLTKGIGHKEFKDTEIGRIPKEWEVLELGDEKITVFIKSGNTPSKEIQEYWNGGILFVTQGDMTKVNKYLYETSEKITELGLKNFNLFIIPENSILLSMYGTIGKVVINKNPVTVSQNIAAIKLNNKNADQEYFFYAIQYYSFQFKKKAKISTMKHLNIKIVKKIYLPLPSLQEQQQIALIISTVDKKLGILKQEKVKLERIKQWFMEELLTGRIRVRVS